MQKGARPAVALYPSSEMRDVGPVPMVEARNTAAAGTPRLQGQGQEVASWVGRNALAPLALANALTAVLQPRAAESFLDESFAYLMASVEAQLGLLINVRAEEPLDVEVICSEGEPY